MTPSEADDLRDAITLVAHALDMDEAEAFRAPFRFGVRAATRIYQMKERGRMLAAQVAAHHQPQDVA